MQVQIVDENNNNNDDGDNDDDDDNNNNNNNNNNNIIIIIIIMITTKVKIIVEFYVELLISCLICKIDAWQISGRSLKTKYIFSKLLVIEAALFLCMSLTL